MIDKQKQEIRKQIRKQKEKYSPEQKKKKSQMIFKKIEELELFSSADIVMAYWSMDDEVYTHDFIQKYLGQKRIILPVVKGDVLILKEFKGITNMITGESYGISEPDGEEFLEIQKIDIILVPGVAFDQTKNRLGRGKAYYDKLLKESNASKIGICFDFQMIDSVPVDEHDIKMDLVITD